METTAITTEAVADAVAAAATAKNDKYQRKNQQQT